MKPLKKLALGSVIGVIPCYVIFKTFQEKVSTDIKKTKIFEEAIEALRNHKGAIYLLGQPISDFRAEYNSFGILAEKKTDVKLKVSGPKSDGILFYSTAADEKDQIKLETIQLQVGKDDTKRLVVKKSSKEIDRNSSNNDTTSSSSKTEPSSSGSS